MPPSVPPGMYVLRVGLLASEEDTTGAIALGTEGKDPDGFYRVGTIRVTR